MPARLRPVLTVLLLPLLPPLPAGARGADTHDWALSAPYAAKAAAPLLIAPLALRDPREALLPSALLLAGLTAPSAAVLARAHGGDGEGTLRWRRLAYACDMALGLGAAAWGLWRVGSAKARGHGEPGDDKAAEADAQDGAWAVALALPMLAVAQLDLIPFHAERRAGAPRAALSLTPAGPDGRPGFGAEVAARF